MPYRIVTNHGQKDDLVKCKCGKIDGDYRATHYISDFLKYERVSEFVCRACKKKKEDSR